MKEKSVRLDHPLHINDGGVECALKSGAATLTMVPSINAILEAKIVAASIHGPAFAVHGALAVPDVIDISSHGVFRKS